MLDLVSGDDLFALISLMRAADARAIILLEGPEDCRALDAHINAAECATVPGTGKSSVLKAVRMSNERRVARVLGVVDSDLQLGQRDQDEAVPNVIVLDAHDMDTFIFYSPTVAERAADQFSRRDLRRNWLRDHGFPSIHAAVESILHPLASIKAVSVREGLGLKLARFPLGETFDHESERLDVDKVARLAILRSSEIGSLDVAGLRQMLIEMEPIEADRTSINGHDVHGLLALLARKAWGGSGKVGNDLVATCLRVAFSCEQLVNSDLFFRVRAWGEKNSVAIWQCPTCYVA